MVLPGPGEGYGPGGFSKGPVETAFGAVRYHGHVETIDPRATGPTRGRPSTPRWVGRVALHLVLLSGLLSWVFVETVGGPLGFLFLYLVGFAGVYGLAGLLVFRSRIPRGKALASLVAGALATALVPALYKHMDRVSQQRAEPVLQALELFLREQKRCPERLEELVPMYLDEVPKTGFGLLIRDEYWLRPHVWDPVLGYSHRSKSLRDSEWRAHPASP